MSGFSLLYSSRTLFHLLLRAEYRGNFSRRYAAVAELVPDGARVVEVCAGDCRLYVEALASRNIEYLGLDIAPALVRWAKGRGVNARIFDLWDDEIPTADYILMQASLYQFSPRARAVVDKMLDAADKQVIIVETVSNLSDSGIPLIGTLASWVTRPSGRKKDYTGERFTEETFQAFLESTGRLERSFLIPGVEEMVGVLRGRADGNPGSGETQP